jgi:hypothetical protein
MNTQSKFNVLTEEGLQQLFDDIAARTKPEDLAVIRSLRERMLESGSRNAEANLKWVSELAAMEQQMAALVQHLPRGQHRHWARTGLCE